MQLTYVLDDENRPVSEPDVDAWVRWLRQNEHRRSVARTKVGSFEVSTVFLGTDHSHRLDGHLPVLWETMIFFPGPNGEMSSLDYKERYVAFEIALEGHFEAVEFARGLAHGAAPEPPRNDA